jgi:hypothetical protein
MSIVYVGEDHTYYVNMSKAHKIIINLYIQILF